MAQQATSTEPLLIHVKEQLAVRGEPSWGETILDDGRNELALICDKPGDSNDAHLHPDYDEWWVVFQGEIIWEIGDYPPVHAKEGDVVVCPAGKRHHIKTVGTEPSLRLAVSKHGSNHDVRGDRSSELEPLPRQELPPNLLVTKPDEMLAHFGEPRWGHDIVENQINRAMLISHAPGMANEAHWHPDFDEWWAVLKGEITWEVGIDRPKIHARAGDIVFVPKGMRHHISTQGDETSLRLAVMTHDAPHIYTDGDEGAPPPRA